MSPHKCLFLAIAITACTAKTPEKDDDTDSGIPTGAFAPEYTLEQSLQIGYGGIWSIPVWDGNQLVISTEKNGSIVLASWDTDLNQTSEPVTVAGPTDTSSGGTSTSSKITTTTSLFPPPEKASAASSSC